MAEIRLIVSVIKIQIFMPISTDKRVDIYTNYFIPLWLKPIL